MFQNTKPILSVCLNPAWQKTLLFQAFAPGAVNRAHTMRETGGGKGVNLARALRCAGTPVEVALFAGGHTGERLLGELSANGIGTLAVPVPEATRICTTIVDTGAGQTTELIEPSAPVPAQCVAEMARRLARRLPDVSGAALCGTYPPGVPASLYATLAVQARTAGVPLLLDGVQGVGEALHAGVDVLKINRDEVQRLTGKDDLRSAAASCFTDFCLKWLAVTDGPHCAYLFGPAVSLVFDLPPVDPVRNPIGAGDCASGVFLAELVKAAANAAESIGALPSEEVAGAFARALAAASASCTTDLPAVFEPCRQQELLQSLNWQAYDRK